jgi:hypothetical protein
VRWRSLRRSLGGCVQYPAHYADSQEKTGRRMANPGGVP